MYLNDILRFRSNAVKEEERKNLKDLLNIVSKHVVEVLADLGKESCRIRVVNCLFDAFYYRCQEAVFLWVGRLRFRKATAKRATLYMVDLSCRIRFSVNLLVTSLERGGRYGIGLR